MWRKINTRVQSSGAGRARIIYVVVAQSLQSASKEAKNAPG